MSRCLNCSVATNRIRSHNVTNLLPKLQNLLTEWLSNQELPSNGLICNACYVLLNECSENGKRSRVMGYTMVCIGCGCAVLEGRYSVRHRTIEENNPLIDIFFSWSSLHLSWRPNLQACHSCWMRANRHLSLNKHRYVDEANEVVPPPLPPGDNNVKAPSRSQLNYLPSYKCAPSNSNHCIFRGCHKKSGYLIPTFIKVMLIREHNYYVPNSCRVCEMHLFANEWHLLPEDTTSSSYFTVQQSEQLIELLKKDTDTFDFNNVDQMPHHVCYYWTGLTVSEFLALYNEISLENIVNEPKTALAIYLIKIKTGESNRRLAHLFSISQTTMELRLNKVRSCLTEHFIPKSNGMQHVTPEQIAEKIKMKINSKFEVP